MNAFFRSLALLAIALLALGLFAAPTMAADSGSSCFAATFFQSIAGDRSKIIQLSIVFVLIGCGLLFVRPRR